MKCPKTLKTVIGNIKIKETSQQELQNMYSESSFVYGRYLPTINTVLIDDTLAINIVNLLQHNPKLVEFISNK